MQTNDTQGQWPRIIGLGIAGFLVLMSYSIARPICESLFVASYTKDSLPTVWLTVPAFTLSTVLFYNRYSSSFSLSSLYTGSTLIACVALTLLHPTSIWNSEASIFLLYIWKDIYIVVLIEIFWSYANFTFNLVQARKLYGFFMACGTVGSFAGNMLVGLVAKDLGVGSLETLWLVIPILFSSILVFKWVAHNSDFKPSPKAPLRESLEVVGQSRYLGWLMALILLVQISITLIDYQYFSILEQQNFDNDQQTQVIGWVYGAIDIGAITLQTLTVLILQKIGIRGTLLMVPIFLSGTVIGFLLLPRKVEPKQPL